MEREEAGSKTTGNGKRSGAAEPLSAKAALMAELLRREQLMPEADMIT